MSKKDYRQGMADAMRAYEGFGEKQEAAIQHIGQQVEKTNEAVADLGGVVGGIADYITDQEKAALYRLNTPIDIADLDAAEKRVLLAILYQLSSDEEELTGAQQNYVRAVQRYLQIHNPQTEINLEAIENVEDVSAQKAILQAVLEFFYLGTHPETYTEDQMDFLDCFQVNRKTRREITSHIKAIVSTVGLDGLAEKYGITEEQPKVGFAEYRDNGRIPSSVADYCISLLGGDYNMQRFRAGLYFLETSDYMVYCRDMSEDYEYKDFQFFRVSKITGKVAQIPIDTKKDFPLKYSWELSYHIHGNTIYFIENDVNREERGYSQLIAIDVEELSYQLMPFKFPIKDYKIPVKFHLSGDKNCLVIYAYILMDYTHLSRESDSKRPLSKVYVIDLAQNDRVFNIEPQMVVRDAFIYDGSIMLLGMKKDVTSLFRYDIKTHTEEDYLPKFNGAFSRLVRPFAFTGNWVNKYGEGIIIEKMDEIEGEHYFLIYADRNRGSSDKNRYYVHLTSFKDEDDGEQITTFRDKLYTRESLGDMQPLQSFDDLVFLGGRAAQTYVPSADKKTYLKEADDYILLGDYLYRKSSSMWYKANVSAGWDNLQWETVSFEN